MEIYNAIICFILKLFEADISLPEHIHGSNNRMQIFGQEKLSITVSKFLRYATSLTYGFKCT